jgi:predicted enzyme related to lactoylglutathione lyase
MSRPESYEPGTPSWVDLASPDVDASASFYGALFGWEARDAGPVQETGGYRMFYKDDLSVAGLAPIMNEGQPPVWTTYVTVADADQAADKATAAGGQAIVTPMDVHDVGRMALFADPVGAVIAVWQPGRHKGAGIVNEPGSLSWNELQTRDVARARAFYESVFGWGVEEHALEHLTYHEWKLGERSVGGMLQMGASFPAEVPPHWLAYFAVEDCDAALKTATGLGARQMMEPMNVEAGRFGVLSDPHGAYFAVIALAHPD